MQSGAGNADRGGKGVGRLLGVGFVLALVGAVLAFALEDRDAALLGISLEPLGGVLIAAGVVLIVGATLAETRFGSGHGGDTHVARTGRLPKRSAGCWP